VSSGEAEDEDPAAAATAAAAAAAAAALAAATPVEDDSAANLAPPRGVELTSSFMLGIGAGAPQPATSPMTHYFMWQHNGGLLEGGDSAGGYEAHHATAGYPWTKPLPHPAGDAAVRVLQPPPRFAPAPVAAAEVMVGDGGGGRTEDREDDDDAAAPTPEVAALDLSMLHL